MPPDPHTSCVTTIVDSQGGDAALLQAVSSSLQKRASEGSLAALLDRATEMESSAGIPSGTTPSRHATGGIASASMGRAETVVRIPQGGAAAIENVDSIVLVYDLDRVETFFRLENHWLPLIERCYGGKVRCRVSCRVVLRDQITDMGLSGSALLGSRDCC